jgi:hypothetical protein
MRSVWWLVSVLALVGCVVVEEEDDELTQIPNPSAHDPASPTTKKPVPPEEPPVTPPTEPGQPGAVQSFVTSNPGVAEMALDATHVYWVVDGTFGKQGEIWRADRVTGQSEVLAVVAERVYSLALDETDVYFVQTTGQVDNGGGSVLRVPKAGGPIETLVTAFWNPTSVAVDDTHVYFTVAVSPDGEVRRVPKAGGEFETVLTDVDNPWDIAVDATHLYVSEMNRGRIIRQSKLGGAVEELASGWIGTGWLGLGETDVYFYACSTGPCTPSSLYSVAKSGGTTELLFETPTNNATKLASTAKFVQWGTWFVPLDDKPAIEIFSDSADSTITAVAADDDAIYLGNFHTGEILSSTLTE